MVGDIRKRLQSAPFEPFRLRTTHGQEYPVPTLNHIHLLPGSVNVLVSDDKGAIVVLKDANISGILPSIQASGASDKRVSIAQYGEDRLIVTLLAELPKPGKSVLTAAGDDCALVRLPVAKHCQLLKTDCVIEGVHFTPDTPPERIGWKALCRPLSDIAAMGGKPKHALVTIALPPESPLDRVQGIYAGIGLAAREFGVDVVGGETARSPGPCFLSICLTGFAPRQTKAALRSGGRPGDLLYVTGQLGGSFASGRHLTFRPRLEEGRWLVKHCPVHAMMDLSDGLGADLPRLARASSAGFKIDEAALPCSDGCPPARALSDGEDYELLFAISPRAAADLERRWRRRFPRVPLTAIGRLTAPDAGALIAGGFDHFAREP